MKLRCITAVLGGLLGTALALHAQFVWTGTTSGAIEDPTNWSPNPSPISNLTSSNVTFGNASNATILLDATAINSAFGVSNGTIAVNNVSFTSTSNAYTFNGSGSPVLSISGNVSTVASASPVVVNNTVGLVLSGGGQKTFDIGASSALGILSNISGASASLVKIGTGTLTLGGANTYSGGTIVSFGTLSVTGSVSHAAGDFTVGNATSDSGVVSISGGGTVSNQTGYLGLAGSSSGSVQVSGTGSTWTNSTYLYVGAQGSGTLTINTGGAVSSANTSVGNNTSGSGVVSVDGSGSTLTNTSTLYVGSQGSGMLSVTNGADVSNDTGSIGNNSGGNGTATIDGAGSTWVNTTQLIVGNASPGTMIVSNGGSVSSATGTVSASTGATSTVMIKDSGSQWTNSSSLRVGFSGIANLTVAGGGTVAVQSGAGTLTLGSNSTGNGTLNIGGQASGAAAASGFIRASTITTGSGTGTLQFKNTSTQASPYYLTQDGTSGGAFISVAGATQIVHNGGYNILPSGNTYSGGTVINGGTLIAGSSVAFGSGPVTVNGGSVGVLNGATVANSIGLNGGRLTGTGAFSSAITIGSSSTLAPGFSVGSLSLTGGLTMATAGAMDFEIQTAGGAPGSGYDFVVVSGGSINVTATTVTPFKIKVLSLNAGAPGNVADFSSSTNYSWVFATDATGIGGFTNPNQFLVDTTGFTNPLNGGTFAVVQGTYAGNPALYLTFTAVPEPSTYALIAAGLGSLLLPALRRR